MRSKTKPADYYTENFAKLAEILKHFHKKRVVMIRSQYDNMHTVYAHDSFFKLNDNKKCKDALFTYEELCIKDNFIKQIDKQIIECKDEKISQIKNEYIPDKVLFFSGLYDKYRQFIKSFAL